MDQEERMKKEKIHGKQCYPGYHKYEQDMMVIVEVTLVKRFATWKTKNGVQNHINKLLGGKRKYNNEMKPLFEKGIILNRKKEFIDDGLDPENPRYIGLKVTTIWKNINEYKKIYTPDYFNELLNDGDWDIDIKAKIFDGQELVEKELKTRHLEK